MLGLPMRTPPPVPIQKKKKQNWRRGTHPRSPNLRRLTSRVVDLTRRRQLPQIFEEIEVARRTYGTALNTIVMNAVLQACVHCRDPDAALRVFRHMARPGSCGVDAVTYSTLLKGLGEARRVDEAFQILEYVEKGTAPGNPKISASLIYGLLDALVGAGDMCRANGLLARYRTVLHNEGDSLLLYNLLMKGYANTDFPLGALAVCDEVTRHGLKPDKLSYNTLLFACVKSGRMDMALDLFAEMKEEAAKTRHELLPDAVTYTTLLKGLGSTGDLLAIQNLVVEMKLAPIVIDRVAYTALIDALLACHYEKGALCIFGELLKRAGENADLVPKPHVYLSMMRTFATRGDFDMVKKLHTCMWLHSVGKISVPSQREADDLLLEAAVNNKQVHLAREILCRITKRRKGISWESRGGMVTVRLEVLSGFSSSLFSPYILRQEVSLKDPIKKYMITLKEANPLPATLLLRKVVMRFYKDVAIPIVDEQGNCIGIVHREDCNELDAPLSKMIRGPPPCVTSSTSIGRVIHLILERRYKMVIVVQSSNVYKSVYGSNSLPLGVFTYEHLLNLIAPNHEPNSSICCKYIASGNN